MYYLEYSYENGNVTLCELQGQKSFAEAKELLLVAFNCVSSVTVDPVADEPVIGVRLLEDFKEGLVPAIKP